MQKSKFFKIKDSNITFKNCPPNAKIKVYYEVIENDKGPIHHSGGKDVKKSRLDLLEKRMDRFEEKMDRFEERMDRFENLIVNLTKEMRDGFNKVNARIDQIETRLDYYGLQIEGINKRLDYNGLKKLPESR